MKYTNPLDAFNSHSVHYVVLAARTTEGLQKYNDSASLQLIDRCKVLGGEVEPGVFMMIDTRRFSQFTIDNFSLDTLISGFSVPGSDTPNATGVKMAFNVIDSVGISFANFLQFLCDQQLQVSFNGMTVLVKLLFVGHDEKGGSKTIQTIAIPAIFDKIQVDLNDTKGVYACELFPLLGMVSNAKHNSKWTSIGTASSYFTGVNDNTLGAVINSFEAKLNDLSLKRYSQMNGIAQTAGEPTKNLKLVGRPVQYMITIPKEWETFKFTGPTQHRATEISFRDLIKTVETQKATTAAEAQKKAQQNSAAPGKDSYVAVDPDLTITEVLDVIFGQTTEVAQLGNFTRKQDASGDLKFYKHIVSVTSDDNNFTVHVDVVEYLVPNVELNKTPSSGATSAASNFDQRLFEEKTDPVLGTRKVPKNFIELDYIFSGKNLDVLNLDLKIENLNWLLLRGTKLGGQAMNSVADEGQKISDGTTEGEDKRPMEGMRQKDPALMPQRTAMESKNFNNIASNAQVNGATPQQVNQQYMANISAFYNAGPIVAKLQLRGNPDMLAAVALQTIPKHVNAVTVTGARGATSSSNSGVKAQYRENFERTLLKITKNAPLPSGPITPKMLTGPSYVSSPVFVKVNVYGPNVNFITNELNGGNFAQQLFYDNFYWLGKITSRIEGTKFTHDLELTSYSVYGHSSGVAKGPSASAVKGV